MVSCWDDISPLGEAFLTVKSNAHTRGSYRCLPAQENPKKKKVKNRSEVEYIYTLAIGRTVDF